MKLTISLFRTAIILSALAGSALNLSAQQVLPQRKFQPEDLFRVRRVGAVAWSADGLRAAIELTRPDRSLGSEVSNEMGLLDVKSQTLRTLSSNAPRYVGFFNPKWSPDGQRLTFLSADLNASVQAWIWTVGTNAASPLRGLDIRAGAFNGEAMAWVDDDHIALLAWDIGAKKSGSVYTEVLRGPNAADGWKRAVDGRLPSVSVLESGHYTERKEPSARLVVVNVRTNATRTLARGRMHNLSVSADGRFMKFDQEEPGVPGQAVSSYFALATPDVDTAYVAVNRGTAIRVIDGRSGGEVAASLMHEAGSKPAPRADTNVPAPRPDATWLSSAPVGGAALYTSNASDGSHLWLCGGRMQPKSSCSEIWHANEWMREIKTGGVESILYKAADGSALTAWLLLPPDYSSGTRLPMVTFVYPGLMYEAATQPSVFSLYESHFWEHPQLFAALGYAVLLPSMPPAKNQSDKLKGLLDGVLPAVDAVIARGIADPDRVAVAGQSDGGFATLGLITETNRFRSAIESAGFSDLVSLYGTFYGQYRYGDAGPPEKGQVLRMLQMEKGYGGLGSPPWVDADLYRAGSAVLSADKVETPLMLIHGDLDFIPIQQDEEFFTALLRQDKRAEFVRYEGEWHTISNRTNVLDLWKRVTDWLGETMATRGF
jgi:dipeptidyl aminopeptidase/acylaminoacyl peptidase